LKRIDALLSDYQSSHRTRGNFRCHIVGVTLIVFGVLSILQTVPIVGSWTLSEALLAAVFLFYVALDPLLAVAVVGVAALLDLAARAVGNWRIGAAAFVVGWIFQAIGHAVYEKAKPAYFRNLMHLLVGPAYLVNEALHIRPRPTR
jgi:2-hydroxy fatty acid dioxygenase